VCRDYLPKKILSRKKRGFAVNVVDDWLKDTLGTQGPFRQGKDSPLNAFLRRDKLDELQRRHSSGQSDNHKLLFSLKVFEQFLLGK
jgi:asparagine synthase (glutamine-hydrolysing)